MILQIEFDENKTIDLLEAVKNLSRNPKIFSLVAPPKLPSNAKEFEARALAIAEAIKPRPNQPMRREILEFILDGNDTWFGQNGQADSSLRNATGALSKALRRFAPLYDSPLDVLCQRQREVVKQGPYKGRYQGTRYSPTPLGKRVRDILIERGILRSNKS